jgi:predicted phage-related endonuclease
MIDEEISLHEAGPVESLDKDKEMINLLDQRKAISDIIDSAQKEKDKLNKDIEDRAGSGTHQYGKWKVSISDFTKSTFDTSSFKKDHPDMVGSYLKETTVHQMRVEERKTK